MSRFRFAPLMVVVLALAFAACNTSPCATAPAGSPRIFYAPAAVAPATASLCGQAAAVQAPCSAPQALYAVSGDVPLYVPAIGPDDHMRAGLAIPPAVGACLVTGASKMLLDAIAAVQCALNALIPVVTPTLHPATAVPPLAPAAPAAPLPCAPAAPRAPCHPPPPAAAPPHGCAPVTLAPPSGGCDGDHCGLGAAAKQ